MPQRTLGVLALLLLLPLTSGCDDTRSGTVVREVAIVGRPAAAPEYEGTPEDFAEIEHLLAERASAIRRGDRGAFMATLDPGNSYLRKNQLVMFRNLQDLPVAEIAYRSGDFAASGAADIVGDDPAIRPDVAEVVRLQAVDRLPVENELEMTFVRREGEWLLGNERKAPATGTWDGPGTRPWYGVRIEVAQRGRLLVIADRGQGGATADLAYRADVFLADISTRLGVPLQRAVLIDATSTGVPTSLNSEGMEAAAVAFPARSADGQRIAGWRIKMNPERVDELLDNQWLLRHELVHFLSRDLIEVSPIWLREGLAEYVGLLPYSFSDLRFTKAFARRFRSTKTVIPTSGPWGADPQLDYNTAHAAVAVLAGIRGIDGLKELIRAYRRTQTGRTIDPHADWATGQVLRDVYGFGLPELTRRTRALVLQTL